jgi:hypothetical protein
VRAHGERAPVDEDRNAEIDALHPRQRDRRRAALGVGTGRGDGLETRIGSNRYPIDLEIGEPELVPDRLRDARAELDGIASHVAVPVAKRERRRAVAVGEHDRLPVADALERRRGERVARCEREHRDRKTQPAAATAQRGGGAHRVSHARREFRSPADRHTAS